MNLDLLSDDMYWLQERYPDNELLYGLYEITSALAYRLGAIPSIPMVFHMMSPAWRG